jgi:hypothetical protein
LQANTSNSFLNSPYGFAIYFVTLWCFVSYLISFLSGWFTLSMHFKKDSEPYGETKTAGPFFYAVYFRLMTHYSSVVRIIAAEDAFYLSVLILFRIGHPPLRIPWDEIQFSRKKLFWRKYVVLTLGREEKIPMRISERMARKLGIMERVPETVRSGQGRTAGESAALP